MAQLIVLDASVVIAALAADDPHHAAAVRALTTAGEADLIVAATTRAEVLVGPFRTGGAALAAAQDFLAGCDVVPVTAEIADTAAALRARHPALSLPDAIALVVAEVINADAVWTFDRSWSGVNPRVRQP